MNYLALGALLVSLLVTPVAATAQDEPSGGRQLTTRRITVTPALIPVRADGGFWDVKVQVVLDGRALLPMLDAGTGSRRWEVGAILSSADGRLTREMLGSARMDALGPGASRPILHQRSIMRLGPGRYDLRAFVVSAEAGLYGDATVSIVLPSTDRTRLHGTLILQRGTEHVPAALPMRPPSGISEAMVSSQARPGRLPTGGRPIEAGVAVEFLSWACLEEIEEQEEEESLEIVRTIRRTVTRDGETLLDFEQSGIRRAGDCVRVVDDLDTASLASGSYTYRVEWEPSEEAPPLTLERPFDVVAPGGLAAPVPRTDEAFSDGPPASE